MPRLTLFRAAPARGPLHFRLDSALDVLAAEGLRVLGRCLLTDAPEAALPSLALLGWDAAEPVPPLAPPRRCDCGAVASRRNSGCRRGWAAPQHSP